MADLKKEENYWLGENVPWRVYKEKAKELLDGGSEVADLKIEKLSLERVK